MKIAIAAEGTRGDIYPMLALGESLAAAGHQIRLIAPPDFETTALARGFEFCALGVSVKDFLRQSAAAIHSRGPRFMAEVNRWGKQSLAHQAELLPRVTRDVDFVIGAGTILLAASAAELHGIPFRYVLYTPAILPSLQHSPAFFPFQSRSRSTNRALWWLMRRILHQFPGRDLNRLRTRMGLPVVTDLLSHLLSDRPLVATDRPLAPVPADVPLACEQVRCLHPHDQEPLPAKLESFLRSGPAPLYLGFGSMTDPDPARTTRRLLDAISQLGCRALISRGWAGIGDGALPEGVMAVDSVSHATLFPRVSLVVHHGGSGTTHAAARAGVPQLIVPHVLDQFYFARRVEELGVAPPSIPRRSLSYDRLVQTVSATLDNEVIFERARELGDELAALGSISIDPDRVLA